MMIREDNPAPAPGYVPAWVLLGIVTGWTFLVAGCATSEPPPPAPVVAEGPPPICSVESPELCLQDGLDLEAGVRGPPDQDAARSKYELACEGGVARGCTRLGALLADSPDAFERARVLDLWQTACDDGEPMACAQLGAHLLAHAYHLDEDDPQRPELFQLANTLLGDGCERDEQDETRDHWGMSVRGYACSTLAASYEQGFGVERDLDRAIELQERGCDLGWQPGCDAADALAQKSAPSPPDASEN